MNAPVNCCNNLRRHLSAEEINELPLVHYEGPVHVVRSMSDWEQALADLSTADVLGFDTETKPTFRKGKVNQPALVQLATSQAVYLVQLTWLPFSSYLSVLLADAAILKAGVGIRFDMLTLSKLHAFTPAGLVDIGSVARMNRIPAQGLRTLAAQLFGWRISKGSQCSNWSLQELSAKQILYAATDAWVSRCIYMKMRELNLNFSRPTERANRRMAES